MNDTPSSELGKLTKELHHQHEFETYLMFIPSTNPNDNKCVWIPLRIVEWVWAAAVERSEKAAHDSPCDKTAYRLLYEAPPRVTAKEDCKIHPHWSYNVTKNSDEPREDIGTEGYDDHNWKQLTAERKKKWR